MVNKSPSNGSILIVANSSPGITLTLQDAGIFLGLVVSLLAIGAVAVKIVNKISDISSSIIHIEESLKEHSMNAEKIRELDKRIDLHLQEYINRKDVVQMMLGQLNEKIDHKFKRTLFYVRDIQKFLQRDTNFIIRDQEEGLEEE